MNIPFTGSLEACATHWNTTHTDPRMFDLLKQFMGIRKRTILEWFEKGSWPKGTNAIRFSVFLQLFGYELMELKECGDHVTQINQALAFGVISVERLQTLLDMRMDSISRVLQGRTPTSSTRRQKLQRFVREHRTEIQSARTKWCELLGLSATVSSGTSSTYDVQPAVPSKVRSTEIAESLVSVLNSIANVARVGITPEDLSDELKQHIAYTTAELFKKLGIDLATIVRLQSRQSQGSTAMGNLVNVLLKTGGIEQ